MLKHVGLFIILLLPAVAQSVGDQSAAPGTSAGCGNPAVQFSVSTVKDQHPAPQPESGKALVYVFGMNAITYRWGVDGVWVGATKPSGYFFAPVAAGDHHLCAQRQSIFSNNAKEAAALSFTAEPGKSYYFRIHYPKREDSAVLFRLEPVDPAEAQILISKESLSESHPK